MAFLFRPRALDCFYCGKRSAQKHRGTVKKWQCEHCEAPNYLDKNGQITDPPVYSSTNVATPPAPRFAYVPPRSISPPGNSQTYQFCDTCLKNQHLLTQTLASYLPAPNDPSYVEYEKSYPVYRAKLEQRYPQVCATCLPGVRERIRRAGYVAKTDHLRRMVQRTRLRGVRQSQSLGWRGFIITAGGIVSALSLVLQIIWHIMSALHSASDEPGFKESKGFEMSLMKGCAQAIVLNREIQDSCAIQTGLLVQCSLILGILTIWWNGKLREKYEGGTGRMFRLKDYYCFQILVLFVRWLAWWILHGDSFIELTSMFKQSGHAFMTLFLVLCAMVSRNIVEISRTPPVTFHGDFDLLSIPEPLQDKIENVSQSNAIVSGMASEPSRAFPISALAPATPYQATHRSPYQPPTPPPEDDDDSEVDAMDWTPSNKNLEFHPKAPSQSTTSRISTPTQPSPFHGSLPKAPVPPAYKLRNPIYSSPPFRKASDSTQKAFFSNMNRTSVRHGPLSSKASTSASVEGDPDDDDASTQLGPGELRVAQPKFFLKQDRVETGLEAMFDEVFSIRDEPKGLPRKAKLRRGSDGTTIATQVDDSDFDDEDFHGRDNSDWSGTLTAIIGPLCILGAATLAVRGLN